MWPEKSEYEPSHLEYRYISVLYLLSTREIVEQEEIELLCNLISKMVIHEGWTLDAAAQETVSSFTPCIKHNQNGELYDEVLKRIRKTYPSTVILDMYIERAIADIYWY